MTNNTQSALRLKPEPDGLGYYYGQYEGVDNEIYRIDIKNPDSESTSYRLHIDGEYQKGFDTVKLSDVYGIIDEAVKMLRPKR